MFLLGPSYERLIKKRNLVSAVKQVKCSCHHTDHLIFKNHLMLECCRSVAMQSVSHVSCTTFCHRQGALYVSATAAAAASTAHTSAQSHCAQGHFETDTCRII